MKEIQDTSYTGIPQAVLFKGSIGYAVTPKFKYNIIENKSEFSIHSSN